MVATPETWLVLPTYDEASNLERIVVAAREQLPDGARVLVVDDNSPDGTGEIADRLAGELPGVSVLHRAHKEGIGPAYVAGFHRALDEGAELVAQMDADFSHDPADLPRLIEAAAGADLVLGSRYVGDQPWGQRLRANGPRRAHSRPHGGIQAVSAPRPRGDRAGLDLVDRLRVSGRDHLPGGSRGLQGRRGADHLHRAPGW
jgi:glycosyltransferase involved in cell wall biosynthesis